MSLPNFEFPVRIIVGGKERPGVLRGNDWVVPLRKGETFEIWVENRSGQTVCMRLLVDGLNTLPDVEKTTKGVVTLIWGQHVNLADAAHWVLDPAKVKRPRKLWAVRGFFTQTGDHGTLREFVVNLAAESLAARRKYTQDMGLITAAFYDSVSRSRSAPTIGIGAGNEHRARRR